MNKFLIVFSIPLFELSVILPARGYENTGDHLNPGKTVNFFIISKRKKAKPDLATRYNILRAKIKSFLRSDVFVAIVADSSEQAISKIIYRLEKHHARAGTIWFDSHGVYKRGYSLFMIGKDEISFMSLRDPRIRNAFQMLVPYTDKNTSIVIGSCYGGATYLRASIDYCDTTRMNGDSLMISLGDIFPKARIYGSESWVMTKPGIFNKKKNAVAGFPKRKLFRDVCYSPAWEKVGQWNEYSGTEKKFSRINHVALNHQGFIRLRKQNFASQKGIRTELSKIQSALKPDLYK